MYAHRDPLDSHSPDAWRLFADHLVANGCKDAADAAYAQYLKKSHQDPLLMQAAHALGDNRLAHAEPLLRNHLKSRPTDIAAIRMLAEIAGRLGRYPEAEKLLLRCLELAPSFTAARHNYALVLHRQNRSTAALREVELLLSADGENPGYRNLQAAILARLGDSTAAVTTYAQVLAQFPRQPKIWMSYGHALKTAGRVTDSIQAYRKSIELSPKLGEAYWSLANLKTVQLQNVDIADMQTQLERQDISVQDELHFHFALGKAFEDRGDYEVSFQHYQRGNQRRRSLVKYNAAEVTKKIQKLQATFTQDFFAKRFDWGCNSTAPIFVVGLPRAGSTLLEQILASHPQVEGTQELPDIISLTREFAQYPEEVSQLSSTECAALGERYLQQTRVQRKTTRAFFIDKMPNNFQHVGFIRLILPHAKIIDARRHPLAYGFSNFKQHFARGQLFSYDLTDIGQYYRDYRDLMQHFSEALPNKIHRVIYEHLVQDTEQEVRKLLDYCGLPFAPECLNYYRNTRAVRTASSEQVRQPIYRQSVDQWQHYAAWLEPLRISLGTALHNWSS
jgi:tetratricopeptide (TPR) repeat protein